MNKQLKETAWNVRARKHTRVVRSFKAKQSNKVRYVMRVRDCLYLLCSDGEWRKIKAHNKGLTLWVLNLFGVKLNNSTIVRSN